MHTTLHKIRDSLQKSCFVLVDALLPFKSDQGGADVCSEIVTDRGKRASEIVMPVWTDVKDDTIAKLGSAKFADEAGCRERNAPDSLECKGHIPDEY